MDTETIARRGTILRTQVGSVVHGCGVGAQDDRDEMGLAVEPPEHVIGLGRFEQHEFRTQPPGVRSGPGDLDLIVYSLRKWVRLALAGNPTVLVPLFVPDDEVVHADEHGRHLREHPELVLSRRAGARFAGYLDGQRRRLLGLGTGRHTNRPELVERYGFDTKFAYHMIRLGIQGTELMATGRITLPMPEPHRSVLVDLRQGGRTKEWALDEALRWETRLREATESSPLPPEPDRAAADRWLIDTYQAVWASW